MKDEEHKDFCWPHSWLREYTWIRSYDAFHWKKHVKLFATPISVPPLQQPFWNCSQNMHTRFLQTPLSHTPWTSSHHLFLLYWSQIWVCIARLLSVFSLQHVLSSSVALKTNKQKTQQTHPPQNPNPLHTSLQTRSKSLILVTTYTLGFTVNLNACNWENGTVEKYSKAPFSNFILILRLQSY